MRLQGVRSNMGSLIVGLAGVICGAGLAQTVYYPQTARAQIPDSGAQREVMIQELRTANQKLTEIAGILREIRDGGPVQSRKDKAPPRSNP